MTQSAVRETAVPVADADSTRKRLILTFSGLLAVSLAFDYSVYLGGLGHAYVHEVATAIVAVIAFLLARRRGSVLPASRGTLLILGLLGLLVLDTIVIGALHYTAVPSSMHKLFWLEHGDALRILFELAVWVWAFGLVGPGPEELWSILEVALWGGAVAVVLDAGFWIVSNQVHLATTTFDLTVMFGLPLAAVSVMRRGPSRGDMIRLGIYGAGGLILYSRAALVVVILAMAVILFTARSRRTLKMVIPPIVAGWAVVLILTIGVGLLPSLPGVSRLSAPPGVTGATTSGSSALGTLLRLFSLGDTQIAGYTLPSRLTIWRDALSIARQSPLFGVGYHDYFAYSHVSEIKAGDNRDPGALFPSLIKAAHNDFLSMLAETGAIGLLIYAGFWILLLMGAIKLWWRKEPDRLMSGFWLGFLLGFAAVSLTGEFLIPRSPIWLAPAIMWWLLIAALLVDVEGRYGWLAWPRR